MCFFLLYICCSLIQLQQQKICDEFRFKRMICKSRQFTEKKDAKTPNRIKSRKKKATSHHIQRKHEKKYTEKHPLIHRYHSVFTYIFIVLVRCFSFYEFSKFISFYLSFELDPFKTTCLKIYTSNFVFNINTIST